MAAAIRLRQEHLDAMIAHALRDAPMECCGMLAGREGLVTTVVPMRNAEESPYRFRIDGLEQKRAEETLDERGESILGFYHSHTGSEARPSATDILMMGPLFGPPYTHFVIGVADPARPVARVFHIEDGDHHEREYEVVR
ncbi:MAG: M67 family metallopeptidase [Dehalococcoidia bacterium]